jgi:L-iditol 2-dehydrogenase
MRAAVYRGPNDLRLETVPVPGIGRNELLVRVAACGVCPTDIKKIQYGTVPPPRIFGHETAGTIVKIGAGNAVKGFRIGDRVALHHHVPCLDCHFCRHQAFAQCAQYKRTGITAGFEPAGGGFAEYVRVMPFVLAGVVKIPAKNTFEEGAMLEPVNTVLKAVKRLALLPGDNVLVAGQGPIGLMFTRLLQLRGVNVLATDLLDSRLQLAKKFGAKWLRNAGKASRLFLEKPKRESESDNGDRREACPTAFDAAVLAVPSDAALEQAFQMVRGAGQILLFAHTKRPGAGIQGPEVRGQKAEAGSQKSEAGSPASDLRRSAPGAGLFPMDLSRICVDEKDLLGSYSADFTLQREVARLVFSRKLDVRGLITHYFSLAKTAEAVELASRPTPDSLKIVVRP